MNNADPAQTTAATHTAPDFDAVLTAASRIAPHINPTPVLHARTLDAMAGCRLLFKCENLQRAGSFKFRGACNAVFSLTDAQAAQGVVTQSSGNHGGAVALACRERGIPATVVVPRGASRVKLAAMESYGARIVPCEPTQASRDEVTARVLEETGAVLVHPFNDPRVIAGQGTATLEMLRFAPDIDTVVVPVSGGGLISGTALAALGVDPSIQVYGAEPAGARDAHDSLKQGERVTGRVADTVCDGLRAELGTLTYPLVRQLVRDILLVEDTQTVDAMLLVWERMKLVIEPSAAIGLAAVLGNPELFAGRTVGIVLSGGNIDLYELSELLSLASRS